MILKCFRIKCAGIRIDARFYHIGKRKDRVDANDANQPYYRLSDAA